jgi:hypothetical protein
MYNPCDLLPFDVDQKTGSRPDTDFHPFVRRIHENALNERRLIAQAGRAEVG